MDEYITRKYRVDKLKSNEQFQDVGNGTEITVSSYQLNLFETLQVMLDDLVFDHGIKGARIIINTVVDELCHERERG